MNTLHSNHNPILAKAVNKTALTLLLVFLGSFFVRAQALTDASHVAQTRDTSATRNTAFTVKTNLLYDAVTALNVEVEIPIGSRFSLLAEDVFPWWHIGNKYALQMVELGAETRFWFTPWEKKSTKKMRGWFVGAYGMSAKYDFQLDTSVDYQGEYWSAGLSGGYVMPIGKKKNMTLEFSIALGFLQTDYRHYLPTDDYLKLIRDPYNVGTVSYFGPTKAKVSLIIPINFGKKEVNHD